MLFLCIQFYYYIVYYTQYNSINNVTISITPLHGMFLPQTAIMRLDNWTTPLADL